MFDFIVSGYIPGTDIQITFEMFLVFGLSFSFIFGLFLLVRSVSFNTQKIINTIHKIEEISL